MTAHHRSDVLSETGHGAPHFRRSVDRPFPSAYRAKAGSPGAPLRSGLTSRRTTVSRTRPLSLRITGQLTNRTWPQLPVAQSPTGYSSLPSISAQAQETRRDRSAPPRRPEHLPGAPSEDRHPSSNRGPDSLSTARYSTASATIPPARDGVESDRDLMFVRTVIAIVAPRRYVKAFMMHLRARPEPCPAHRASRFHGEQPSSRMSRIRGRWVSWPRRCGCLLSS